MCKAKKCMYWKECLVKRECTDFHCADYKEKKEKKEVKKNETRFTDKF